MYGSPSCSTSRLPRLLGWLIVALVMMLGLALAAPEQVPVIFYKLSLVVLGAVLAYWLDRALFPYGRPHTCLSGLPGPGGCVPSDVERDRSELRFAFACLRRALIVLACVLGLTLGL
ncbi:MAG: hypothetical protein CVV07_01140 [Gammaproteobacteria bacterium HGW-Gammaproteobacteria-11]|nr:MAG: hypothetical protein CVV07_01140 [Gammaproteobacteria bacterium HGW-Gammaproteobacteria-11]